MAGDVETHYQRLVEYLPEPVVIHVDGRVAYANPAAARLLGAPDPGALVGRSIVDFAEPTLRDTIRERMRAVLEEGRPAGRAEQRYVRLDGSGVVDVEVEALPFTYRGRAAVLSLARDVTDRKRLQARLLESQKMEAVGQMASRVAHDFNNLLVALIASAEMILDAPGDGALAQVEAREIRETALRGAALTRQLLSSSHREAARRPVRVELNAVVRREEPLLRRLLSPRAGAGPAPDLRLVLPPIAGVIDADPDQLGQVLLNLVVNARDAMPGGGTITVATDAVRVGAVGLPAWPELASGDYALLAVHDTGMGMDQATRARIFEPFFTTKQSDGGTGLGLAIVADIVRESGGVIHVESAPGDGSSFLIAWPRSGNVPAP